MRLWHKDLIPLLPRQQLLGQWRECVLIAKNIAENGTPNHVLVNKVTEYPIGHFTRYCRHVFYEMVNRGYNSNYHRIVMYLDLDAGWNISLEKLFDGWHNDRYLAQCLANLQEKYDCGAVPEEDWKKITARWPEWR